VNSITHPAPLKVQRAAQALLTRPGTCTPALRQAVEAHAAALSGGDRPAQDLPADLVAYVEKVTRHADQVTDQDVQALREAGYSEDAIFEITLCASLGASLARLERGLLALAGG
jgi:alkylhydroperoxidase family enzyme